MARKLLLSILLFFVLSYTLAATVPKAGNAFADLDNYFVEQYSAVNKIIGKETRPVLIINGFTYQLYTKDGVVKSFNGLVSPFNELKAVSHIGPAIYTIAAQAWANPNDKQWQDKLLLLQTKVKNALSEVDSVDWHNASWPNKGDDLKSFIKASLQLVDNQINKVIQKGTISKEDYQAFAQHYMHTMVATMYLADVANTNSVLQQLKKWKSDLGPKEWDNLYVLIMGSKGRTSSELTTSTNTAAITMAGVMKPELVKTHVIIMPMALSKEQVLATLGAIINANNLAEATFVTDRAKKTTGLYKALKTATVPLARDNVVHIVHQEIVHGRIKLPEFNILAKDQEYVKALQVFQQ